MSKSRIGGRVLSTYSVSYQKSRLFSSLNSAPAGFEAVQDAAVQRAAGDILKAAHEYRSQHNITIVGADAHTFHPITEFHSTPFATPLKKVFVSEKYTTPTPIQAQTWPIILSNRDVISVAKTGSGKTVGFILPAIHRILEKQGEMGPVIGSTNRGRRRQPSVLVMAPTRELSVQIEEVAKPYALSTGLVTTCLFGGAAKGPQIKDLERGVDVVVGTPGRINDLLNMGCLNLRNVHYLVLDEADRMLDMGFEPQIRSIIEQIPAERQSVFFSATWPREVQSLASEFMSNPVLITAGEVGTLNANPAIKQHIEVISGTTKINVLLDLMKTITQGNSAETASESPNEEAVFRKAKKMGTPKTIIFMARKIDCDDLADTLKEEGYVADSLHGDMTQAMRSRTLDRFRNGYVQVLVATDVAARGIDVKDIEVVINYDFPKNLEDYVHRIGRTARGEKSGSSYSFFSRADQGLAKGLVSLLRRSNQDVPQALLELSATSRESNGRFEARGRGRSPQSRFGGPSNRYGGPSRPGEREDRFGGDRFGGDRFGGDRFGGDRFGGDRFGGNRYGGDRFGGERFGGQERDRFDGASDRSGVRTGDVRFGSNRPGGRFSRDDSSSSRSFTDRNKFDFDE